MNTLLNSAQQAQVDQFRSFARQHLTSVSEKLVSREACLKEFLQKLGQQGYLGLHVAKEYGGSGGTLLDVVLLVEALAEMEPGLGLTIGNHVAPSNKNRSICRYSPEASNSRRWRSPKNPPERISRLYKLPSVVPLI